jgi:serine/threonine-protein kinase RsbW
VTGHDAIVVSGPAVPETLRVLRGVAASVGSRADMPFDRLEELRIAVDEAATLVLRAGAATRLELAIHPSAERGLEVRVSSDARVDDAWSPAGSASWGWRVIDELADSATVAVDDGAPVVRFVWHFTGRDG